MATFEKFKDKLNDFFFSKVDDYKEEGNDAENTERSQGGERIFEAEQYSAQRNENLYSPPTAQRNDYYSSSSAPKSNYMPPEYNPNTASQGGYTAHSVNIHYREPERKAPNIYNLDTVRSTAKFKLNFVNFKDLNLILKIADLVMKKDTIVILETSSLPVECTQRATDFLDGVNYVTKSSLYKLSDVMSIIVPEGVELHGDFPTQVDLGSLKTNIN